MNAMLLVRLSGVMFRDSNNRAVCLFGRCAHPYLPSFLPFLWFLAVPITIHAVFTRQVVRNPCFSLFFFFFLFDLAKLDERVAPHSCSPQGAANSFTTIEFLSFYCFFLFFSLSHIYRVAFWSIIFLLFLLPFFFCVFVSF